jgi:hypothetical protein
MEKKHTVYFVNNHKSKLYSLHRIKLGFKQVLSREIFVHLPNNEFWYLLLANGQVFFRTIFDLKPKIKLFRRTNLKLTRKKP